MSHAGNSLSESQYFGYCLVDFNSSLDFRTVEFQERVPDGHVCDSCGVVSGEVKLLPCMHVSCKRCSCATVRKGGDKYTMTCAVDKKVFEEMSGFSVVKEKLYDRRVRCPSTSDGCNHTCTLRELEAHFHKCQFFWTVCSLCGVRLLFKKLPEHYAECRSLLSSAAATFAKSKQLIQHLANATKEVEEAVTKNSGDAGVFRKKMDSVLEVLEKLRVQVGDAKT